jgi:hypothetical protein
MRMRVLMSTAAILLLGVVPAARAQTLRPTRVDDPAGGGNCPSDCSLRQAFAVAGAGDTIELDGTAAAPVTYSLTQGGSLVSAASGVTLAGGGPGASVIDGSNNMQYRILKVSGGSLAVHDVGFTFGNDGHDENCSPTPCATLAMYGGGDIYNSSAATLTLDDVAFSGAASVPDGGGLSNSGTATLHDVLFQQTGAAFGGGLFNRGTLTADRVTFDRTGSGSFGGGAIYNASGNARLTNTTIYGSGWGSSLPGGLYNAGGSVTLLNSTLAGNIRGAIETDGSASTSVGNTIIGSGEPDGGDYACVRTGAYSRAARAITHDLGGNIDQDDACELSAAGSQRGVDPRLGALAMNGGLVPTMALAAGSPALDAVPPGGTACATTDARSIVRPQGTGCDIGAFELEVTPPDTRNGGEGDGGPAGGGTTSGSTQTGGGGSTTTTTTSTNVGGNPRVTRTTSTTSVAPLPLRCSGKDIMLLDVHRAAGRIVVSGLALAQYAGRTVTLTAAGSRTRAGTATVHPDGTFSATLPAPSGGGGASTSYKATVAGVSSASTAIAQPRIAAAVGAARRGRVTVTLHVAGGAKGDVVTVSHQTGCSSTRLYKKVVLGRGGAATVTVPAPTSGFAVYHATAARGHARLASPAILVHA